MTRFIFDLDGTISAEETLPLIAARFGIEEKIGELTRETIAGNIPFAESFAKRVKILSYLPVSEINELLRQVRLHPALLGFIHANRGHCAIATGNLDCWVHLLLQRIGIESHSSSARVENDRVVELTKILRKEDVVKKFKERGEKVVFIGEGHNDLEAMRLADISIASALTHSPAGSVLKVADHLVYEEGELCRLLNRLSQTLPAAVAVNS